MLLQTIGALIALASAVTPTQQPGWNGQTTLPTSGIATYYGENVMEQVANYRLSAGDVQPCSECIGYVSMPRKQDIGRKVWIAYQDSTIGPFLAVDCASERDFPNVVGKRLVVEVSRKQGRAWRMTGPIEVIVLDDATLRALPALKDHGAMPAVHVRMQ